MMMMRELVRAGLLLLSVAALCESASLKSGRVASPTEERMVEFLAEILSADELAAISARQMFWFGPGGAGPGGQGSSSSSSSSGTSTVDEASSEEEEEEVAPSGGSTGEVESASAADCDFETDLCDWSQDSSATLDWTRQSGSTPSSNTGPSDDPTSSGGYYLYTEASVPATSGDTSRLVSPTLDKISASGRCMRFFYHMYGSGTGSLNIYRTSGTNEQLLWHRDGDQGQGWHEAAINLPSSNGENDDGQFSIIFEGIIGSSAFGDTAIDDITFEEEACLPVPVHCGENNERRKRRGTGQKRSVDDLLSRILGGQVAESGQWPWQVQIRTTIPGTMSYMQCGGTLISNRWIVSAAHCIEYEGDWLTDPESMMIYLGEIDVVNWEESQFAVAPELIIKHPSRTVQGVAPYDIILIKLQAPVTLGDTVNTACLPADGDVFPAGTSCVVSGWGVEDYTGGVNTVLEYVDQTLFELNTCSGVYGSSVMNEDMLCAGSNTEVLSACQGDSGGPLVCQIDDYYVVLGVVSFGAPCGMYSQALPGVYASVQYFLSWIEDTIQAN